jgi:hypothetical protein
MELIKHLVSMFDTIPAIIMSRPPLSKLLCCTVGRHTPTQSLGDAGGNLPSFMKLLLILPSLTLILIHRCAYL